MADVVDDSIRVVGLCLGHRATVTPVAVEEMIRIEGCFVARC